jgi:hypothetical protein
MCAGSGLVIIEGLFSCLVAPAGLSALPLYDAEHRIVRGRDHEIP